MEVYPARWYSSAVVSTTLPGSDTFVRPARPEIFDADQLRGLPAKGITRMVGVKKHYNAGNGYVVQKGVGQFKYMLPRRLSYDPLRIQEKVPPRGAIPRVVYTSGPEDPPLRSLPFVPDGTGLTPPPMPPAPPEGEEPPPAPGLQPNEPAGPGLVSPAVTMSEDSTISSPTSMSVDGSSYAPSSDPSSDTRTARSSSFASANSGPPSSISGQFAQSATSASSASSDGFRPWYATTNFPHPAFPPSPYNSPPPMFGQVSPPPPMYANPPAYTRSIGGVRYSASSGSSSGMTSAMAAARMASGGSSSQMYMGAGEGNLAQMTAREEMIARREGQQTDNLMERARADILTGQALQNYMGVQQQVGSPVNSFGSMSIVSSANGSGPMSIGSSYAPSENLSPVDPNMPARRSQRVAGRRRRSSTSSSQQGRPVAKRRRQT